MANSSLKSIEDAITAFQKSIPEERKQVSPADFAELMRALDDIKRQIRELWEKNAICSAD